MFPTEGIIPLWCMLLPAGIEIVWLWMFVPRLLRDSLTEIAIAAGETNPDVQPQVGLWVSLLFIGWHALVLPLWAPLMFALPGPWARFGIGVVMMALTPLLHACWLAAMVVGPLG